MTLSRAVCGPFAAIALAAALSGCAGPDAFVREGDANSVEISFRSDVDSAWPLARRHCAAYERVPQLVSADGETASYDCVKGY